MCACMCKHSCVEAPPEVRGVCWIPEAGVPSGCELAGVGIEKGAPGQQGQQELLSDEASLQPPEAFDEDAEGPGCGDKSQMAICFLKMGAPPLSLSLSQTGASRSRGPGVIYLKFWELTLMKKRRFKGNRAWATH